MEVIVSATPISLAADHLSQLLAENNEKPVLLMLSGGSALGLLEYIDISALGPNVTITTLDERFSTDSSVNNFAQIAATNFYKIAVEQGAETIPTLVKNDETLLHAGEHFANALHLWRDKHPQGVIITTMGVGSDGHTAGIFSQQPGLDFATNDWVVAYEVSANSNPYTKRITVTPKFLQTQITHAICVIMGDKKCTVLKHIQDAECTLADVPACILKEMPSVMITTDIHIK